MPAEFCEAHHNVPWSQGGKTDLKDGKLLCPFHHHRAHDPGWITHHHPNGTTSFTRRPIGRGRCVHRPLGRTP